MIRIATLNDLDQITEIYEAIHDEEESGKVTIGWNRSIYPTRETARKAIALGDMFVMEEGGRIVGSARINQEEVPEYKNAHWHKETEKDRIMVLHTLTIDPREVRKGYAQTFVSFYESYAREHDCDELRMDTNAINTRARHLYKKLGYIEVDIVPCDFNGIKGISLVCLEKTL